jgi:hypothetical protein
VVAFNLKQFDVAEQALRAAMTHEKSAKLAAEWLNHLQAEIAYLHATEAAEAAEDKPDDTKTN